MRSTNAVRRATGTVALAVAALLALTGCILDTPPPEESAASMDALTAALERLPHVASADGELRQVDAKDHPRDWIAEVTVRADSADLDVAVPVRERADDGVTGATLHLTLEVPRAAGLAAVRVDPSDAAVVSVADRLRRLDLVRSVELTERQDVVEVRGDTAWSAAVAAVRPALGASTVTVSKGHGGIGVDATRPGPALLRVLDSGAIHDPSSSLGPTYAAAASDQRGWTDRTTVSGEADDPAAVAALLAQTPDEAADAHLAPRTRFVLWQPGADGVLGDEQDGYLGLPLGSARPEDGSLPGDGGSGSDGGGDAAGGTGGAGSDAGGDGAGGTGGLPSPTWSAVPVPEQTAVVQAFLDAAVRSTGVAAEVTTSVEPCSPDGTGGGAQTGTRAVASAVVPVFTRYDDAQEPFDAVVGQWREAGFRTSGRAMGRDFFSAPSPGSEDVASTSIRGTADGLSLGATSSCVG